MANSKYRMIRNSATRDQDGDCSVVCLAALFDMPYDTALAKCRSAGLKPTGGILNHRFQQLVLDEATESGLRVERVALHRITTEIKARYNYNTKNVTTKHPAKFPEVFASGVKYFGYTNGHVVAIDDRETVDWSDERSLRFKHLFMLVRD